MAQFGVKTFGETNKGEFAGDIRKHVWHGKLAADASDVDDGCVFVAGLAIEQMRERGVSGVECGEEVGGHGSAVGGDGLVFNGADFDDAGVVDEDVDAAKVADGVVDEEGSLGGVGEVGGDEENVVGRLDGSAIEEGVAGVDELFEITGGEDEFGSGSGVAFCKSEAKATRASCDEHDLARVRPWCA